MREIAEACQLSKAAIYYHFKNKEDLFIENLRQALEELGRTVEQASGEGADCRERMTNIASAYLDMVMRKKSLVRLAAEMMGELGAETEEVVISYHRQIPGLIESVLADGVANREFKPVDVSFAALCFIGILNAFMIERIWGGAAKASTDEDVVERVVDLLFYGISR